MSNILKVKKGNRTVHPVTPLQSRFWGKVAKRGPEECWVWLGGKDKQGYGAIGAEHPYGKNKVKAHRLSLMYKLGRPILEGLCALHTCDNPSCVNPNHIVEGTKKQNTQDMLIKGRASHESRCPGEKNKGAKLKEYDVLNIVKMLNLKIPHAFISANYGLSLCTISNISTGKSWNYLTKRKIKPTKAGSYETHCNVNYLL